MQLNLFIAIISILSYFQSLHEDSVIHYIYWAHELFPWNSTFRIWFCVFTIIYSVDHCLFEAIKTKINFRIVATP